MKLKDTLNRNSFRGGGDLGAIQTATMGFGDTVHPMIKIGSDPGSFAGEDPKKRILKQTFQIDADGGGSTNCIRLILKRYIVDEEGTAVATGVTVTIDDTEYTTGSGGIITDNIDGDDYATLHDFIDAINDLPGYQCFIGDALTTHDMNTVLFIDAAAADLPSIQMGGVDAMFRDVSEDEIAYMRIGAPRKFDEAPLDLIGMSGLVTAGADLVGVLVTDNMGEYKSDGSHIVNIKTFTPSTSLTEIVDDDVLSAGTRRGSWVLKVSSSAGLAGVAYDVMYRNTLAQ